MYLCYDIKGIQRFIFSVPKLKCIVGGSGMIAQIDDAADGIAKEVGVDRIFSGGGRGVFRCTDEDLSKKLRARLLDEAHRRGLDIRFGEAAELSDAVQGADHLHPYCPDDLEGDPCEMSGLWPVGNQSTPNVKKGVHPMIWRRVVESRKDELGSRILDELRASNQIPEALQPYKLEFFRNVNPRMDDDDPDQEELETARASYDALGRRNRWAVIAMDGNDMGRQFLKFEQHQKERGLSEQKHAAWLKQMSDSLSSCTRQAFLHALGVVMDRWTQERLLNNDLQWCQINDDRDCLTERLVLPFRPLILGGDDVTMLCHASYAMVFAREMAASFNELSKEAAHEAQQSGLDVPLWPATNNELTISAGILFVKSSFPLSMAIPYTESLLASAKGRFRSKDQNQSRVTPAAIDWESITDTLVDTPSARRNRELVFHDDELGVGIELTQRPHSILPTDQSVGLDKLDALKDKLAELPKSVRAELQIALSRPWSGRTVFLASIAKRHSWLKTLLWEDDDQVGAGWLVTSESRSTAVLDSLSLLDEQHRLSQTIEL